MVLITHAIQRITGYFTGGGLLLAGDVTQLYKELTYVKFVGTHCSELNRMMKERHQEELK